MALNITEDIHSITDLKRQTGRILEHLHQTGRPVVLTINGKADAVLLDARVFQKYLEALNMSHLLSQAENDVRSKKTRPIRTFLKQFKHARKISG